MPLDPQRLIASLGRMASIGSLPGGGVSRLALSETDHSARALLVRMIREAGMAVRIDRFGNIWGRTGGEWGQPAVVAGSHLDTVPDGGRYDGALGVLAALEVVRAITEDCRLPEGVPLGVADFAVEESSRYGISTVGSKGLAGVLSEAELASLRDLEDGQPFLESVAAHAGYELVPTGPEPPGEIGCFLELHIEQGRELELHGVHLGVVRAIAAPTRFRVTVSGEAAHSGATLMTWRKDGLVAASELVLALERIAEVEEDHGTVATATIFALHPVSINVVPGRVELGVDIRGIDGASKRRAVNRFRQTVRRVSTQRGIPIELEQLADEEPVILDEGAVECVRTGCERAGFPYLVMHSRAGHDAMNMSRICPAGMLFVPSRGGVSHHPAEYTGPESIAEGAAALMEAVLAAAAMVRARGAGD